MQEFTPIQKLDFLLTFFKSRPILQSSDISTHFASNSIHIDGQSEISRLIRKLLADKYIDTGSTGIYTISVDGYLFEEHGGYASQLKKVENEAILLQREADRTRDVDQSLKDNSKRLNVLTFWLAIGTGALAIMEIVKFILEVNERTGK